MKKITLTLKMLLFVALLATWSSCSKSDDNEIVGPTPVNPTPNTPDTPTPSEPDDPYMTVCEHVAEVAKNVDVYYFKSNTLGEMEKYLDEIKSIQYVEDAYASGSELFVRIKDYGKISYSFFPQPIKMEMDDPLLAMAKQSKRRLAPGQFKSHQELGIKKIAFVSQLLNDEKFNSDNDIMLSNQKYFKDLGFDVPKVIEPDVDFFKNGIFAYDFVLLDTHGGFDKNEVTHSFLTSEQPSNTSGLDPEYIYTYKDIPTTQVYFTNHKEKRNEIEVGLWYAMVTEHWINSSTNSFTNQGKAIVFNTACHSMQGVGTNSVDSIGYSVGAVFMHKGAGAYFGYDESNSVGTMAGTALLYKLLCGMTLDNAYKDLPFDLLHELRKKDDTHNRDYWSDLAVNYDPVNPDIKSSCLLNPLYLLPMEYQLSNNGELTGVLKAKANYIYVNYYEYLKEGELVGRWESFTDIPNYLPIRYGFYVSETKDIDDARQLCSLSIGSTSSNSSITNERNIVSFQHLLSDANLKPQTTYFYWAYFYDGKDYYFSDMDSFKTPAKTSSGSGELPNVPGSDL